MAAEVAKADQAKAAPTKPERPSEEEFKAKLANAEKELKAVEERMVSHWTAHALLCLPVKGYAHSGQRLAAFR